MEVVTYTVVIAISLQHCEVRRQCGGAALQDNKFYYYITPDVRTPKQNNSYYDYNP